MYSYLGCPRLGQGAEIYGAGELLLDLDVEKVQKSNQATAWAWCKLRNNTWKNQEKITFPFPTISHAGPIFTLIT